MWETGWKLPFDRKYHTRVHMGRDSLQRFRKNSCPLLPSDFSWGCKNRNGEDSFSFSQVCEIVPKILFPRTTKVSWAQRCGSCSEEVSERKESLKKAQPMKNKAELVLPSETTNVNPFEPFYFYLPHRGLYGQGVGWRPRYGLCFHCWFCSVLFCWVFFR